MKQVVIALCQFADTLKGKRLLVYCVTTQTGVSPRELSTLEFLRNLSLVKSYILVINIKNLFKLWILWYGAAKPHVVGAHTLYGSQNNFKSYRIVILRLHCMNLQECDLIERYFFYEILGRYHKRVVPILAVVQKCVESCPVPCTRSAYVKRYYKFLHVRTISSMKSRKLIN